MSELLAANGDGISIVLVGSAARGVRDENSDIDLLLVGNDRPKIPRNFSGFHIQATSCSEFLQNLTNGEDFESWCVRFGEILEDGGNWNYIQESSVAAIWPRWELKVAHGARRLFLAQQQLELGDEEAAAEELVYSLGHVARGLLLKKGQFPLSRPELAIQVRELGYPHLADLHEKLRKQLGNKRLLSQAIMYSKKLLCYLDPEVYEACSDEYQQTRREKKRKSKGSH